jgi:hypothetical protein
MATGAHRGSGIMELGVDGADESLLGVRASVADLTEEGGQITSRFGAHASSLNSFKFR